MDNWKTQTALIYSAVAPKIIFITGLFFVICFVILQRPIHLFASLLLLLFLSLGIHLTEIKPKQNL